MIIRGCDGGFVVFCFFFQAEDGIRDTSVTGVQTCALPISLLALGTRSEPCAPLAIVHGSADAVVAPRCAEELLAQALESLRRAGLEPSLTETTPDGGGIASTDYRAASGLVVRRVLIRGAGHAWTGGPGGHPYCEEGGMALTALCARFLRDAGLFESSPAPSP